jgi:amino acid transporter
VVFTSLLPGSVMAMGLGSLIIGEEGQAIWRIYAAPISPRNLVKSKYFSVVLFGLIITVITGTVSALFFGSTFKSAIILSFEAVFLVFALGAISLSNGIKGADFNELPRPRMIRMEWNIINFVACALCGLAIISPLILYTVSKIFPAFGLGFSDSITGLVISGIIAAIVTAIFYRISISNAKELLSKAQS